MMKSKAIQLRKTHHLSHHNDGGFDGFTDVVLRGSPLQTAQLIGALVIRFVMYARSGENYSDFPDKGLLEAILENTRNRHVAEEHLVGLLYHHSMILDNCGTPSDKKSLHQLAKKAFPTLEDSTLKRLLPDIEAEFEEVTETEHSQSVTATATLPPKNESPASPLILSYRSPLLFDSSSDPTETH